MRFRTIPLAALVLASLACGDEDFLADPSLENVVDTVTLGALRHTPISIPSGFSVSQSSAVFTTGTQLSVDFLYDLDSAGAPVFVPAQVAGLLPPSATNPGLKVATVPFDSIRIATRNGYTVDQPLPVDTGDVFLLRSFIRCSIGVPHYGKLRVTEIDTTANTVTFLVLVNQNCGYRGLETGLPDN